MDSEKTRRLEELTSHENRERYIDILNVHAAADKLANTSGQNETYHS